MSSAPPASPWLPLQRLAPRVAGVEVVPEGDVVLALDPAQVHLTALAQRREVDQPPVQVAENDAAVGELGSAGAELDERLTDLPAAAATAVAARGADQGLTCLGAGEPVARVPQGNEPLPHPRQLRPRLLERVMAVVTHQAAQYIRPTGRRRAAPRLRRAGACRGGGGGEASARAPRPGARSSRGWTAPSGSAGPATGSGPPLGRPGRRRGPPRASAGCG